MRKKALKQLLVTHQSINAELRGEIVRLSLELSKATATTGSDRPNRHKLNLREVSNIRALRRSGYSQKEIAEIYDVNPATVSRIVRGEYYKGAAA